MELNIIKSNYKSSLSQKKTLVFLHGNSMNASLFEKQLNSKYFKDYNIIAIDLPGHGKSKKMSLYSIPKVVEVVFQNIKNYKDIILVGHSLGGHIAVQLIPLLKKNCKAISLISCSLLTKPLNVFEAYNMNEVSSYFLQEKIPENIFKDLSNLIYEGNDEIKIIIENSIKNTDSKFRSDISKSVLNEEIKDEFQILKRYKGKIGFIIGKNDLFVNSSYIQKIKQEPLLNSKLNIIPNAGHSPHLNFPEQFNEVLAEFLK